MDAKRHIFLMYCGCGPYGREHRKWEAREAEPLVTFKSDRSTDSFFPAFLLLALRSKKGHSLIPGFGSPGEKEDWQNWLEELFLPEHNLAAIARVVETNRLEPVDIWIALPYPEPAQSRFGCLTRRCLDFSRRNDRELALKWWINRFLSNWHSRARCQQLHRHLILRGFYWPRESMTLRDRLLLPRLLSHIRALGYRTLWIPYFAATPFLNVLNPGFDITIIQPSYLQNPSAGWNRLAAAAQRAKKHGAGIEIEFDNSALFENTRGYRTAIDYLNRGLPQYDGYMTGGFVAYYTGYKTVVNLYQHKKPLYTYLYRFVKGSFRKVDYPGIDY